MKFVEKSQGLSYNTRNSMSDPCYYHIYLHQLNLGNILDRYSFYDRFFCHEPHYLGEVIKNKRTVCILFRTSQ